MNMAMDIPSICLVMANERLDGSDSCAFGPVLLCLFKRGRGLRALTRTRRFQCLPRKKRVILSESPAHHFLQLRLSTVGYSTTQSHSNKFFETMMLYFSIMLEWTRVILSLSSNLVKKRNTSCLRKCHSRLCFSG
jgi:hypothetical protein